MKEITVESPEFKTLYDEISQLAEEKRLRETMSEESLRLWMCEAIQMLCKKLGYIIQNVYEVLMDVAWSAGQGFRKGVQQAKDNAIRKKRG